MSIYTIADTGERTADGYLIALAPKINHVHIGELLGVYQPGRIVTAIRYGYVSTIVDHDDANWLVTLEPVPAAKQRRLSGR